MTYTYDLTICDFTSYDSRLRTSRLTTYDLKTYNFITDDSRLTEQQRTSLAIIAGMIVNGQGALVAVEMFTPG